MKLNTILIRGLILLGIAQSMGLTVAGISVASPLAKVFSSFRGIDTFALRYEISVNDEVKIPIDRKLYSQFEGPFAMRNIYGGAFSYGVAFDSAQELVILNHVLSYGFCRPGQLAKFITQKPIRFGSVNVTTQKNEFKQLKFACPSHS